MRIALDAMGSDNCPFPDVVGGVMAAREFGDTVLLVGDAPRIESALASQPIRGAKIEIVPASEQILMADRPSLVGKSKPGSSVHIGLNLVRDGLADAFVSAGNTGAILTVATLHTLKRIRGVKRPALSAILRASGRQLIMLDIGANADTKPEWMAQFALMGAIYARHAFELKAVRVALLSNGEEENKGNQLIQDSAALLKSLPLQFIGNIEPKELVRGVADVVVTDGFVGNITIKAFEAFGSLLFDLIRTEVRRSPLSILGALLARPSFRRVYKQIDPFEIGGAPLLGVNGVVIIGHGRSDARAIKNAVGQARLAVQGHIVQAIQEEIGKTHSSSTE